MNEDIITDLKQFIAATLSQQLSGLNTDVQSPKTDVQSLKTDVTALRSDVQRIDMKIDDLATVVSETLDANNDAVDERLNNHEYRIAHLESQKA